MKDALLRFRHRSTQMATEALKSALWAALYWPWVLRSRRAAHISIETPHRLTVLVPTYSPARMRDLDPLIRSILRCAFVEKIIVSNNNPEARIRDYVKVRNQRLALLDQSVRRGPGFTWILASQEDADYFLSLDDDVLLYPEQLALLFRNLRDRPAVPHGLAGTYRSKYVQGREQEVDNLYLLYAATRDHVNRYLENARDIVETGLASDEDIEYWSNDIVLSASGASRPLIHDAGFLLQGRTCYDPAVAIHKQGQFASRRHRVEQALEILSKKTPLKMHLADASSSL
jgi:hypothetical protein